MGLLAFLLQPRVRIERPRDEDSAPLSLGDTERAAWLGGVGPSGVYLWVVGGTLLLLLGTAVMVLLQDGVGGLVLLILFVVMTSLLATCSWFRVRIDDTGIEARSTLGWPRFHVPAADIERVAVAQISPFSEFGGWGLRWVPGGFGLVMRTGEGIVVTRKGGRSFTVTIDDAETGAALLAAAADRTDA
ncbi:hypothetical protein G7067_10230 [Leucobacter insecticola]|uniref:DUF3093 domain-containing protein n=1 Tax=Leucobacter insecticola TaxID=2714934 RepID=A0A6G8FJZ6_9MICO|nr:hypothetical protein [Leucobacter insecticola]QIM16697.1 hypothetical protein G7067_10230 [Leucobacter insecticola]